MTIDVIRLAREAGIEFQQHTGVVGRVSVTTCGSQSVERLERFAALVAAEVMEEDAKVCDALKDDETQFNAAVEKQLKGNDEARQLHALRMLSNVQLYNAGFIKSAAAIRARKPE